MGVAMVRQQNRRLEDKQEAQTQLADAYQVIVQQQQQIAELTEAVGALAAAQTPPQA